MDSNQVFQGTLRYKNKIIENRIKAINDRYEVINLNTTFTSGTITTPNVVIQMVKNSRNITCHIEAIQVAVGGGGMTSAFFSNSFLPINMQGLLDSQVIRVFDINQFHHSYIVETLTHQLEIKAYMDGSTLWGTIAGNVGWDKCSFSYVRAV